MGALGVEFVLFDQAGRCIYHEVYQYILPCFVFIPAQAIRRCFPLGVSAQFLSPCSQTTQRQRR